MGEKTILIVEDEMLIAMHMEDLVSQRGFAVAGPAGTVAESLRLLACQHVDFALIDVNLRGESSFPIADELKRRGVPFVFVSGYTESAVRHVHPDVRLLRKPIRAQDLNEVLIQVA